MGFLDFLKKEQPAVAPRPANDLWPSDAPPLPPPPTSRPTSVVPPLPQNLSWTSEPAPASPSPWMPDQPPQAPTPTPAPFAPVAPITDPTPTPAPMATVAQEPFAPASSPSAAPGLPPMAAPREPLFSAVELPDFTDEDLAVIEQIAAPLPALPKAALPRIEEKVPELPKVEELPKVKLVTEEPIVPAPANAVALPPDEVLLPLGEETTIEALEPAKFISSQSYLLITGEAKAIRKVLRQNDDLVKDATLRHEQLDQQYKRAAADINAIQEYFIKIDSALFED